MTTIDKGPADGILDSGIAGIVLTQDMPGFGEELTGFNAAHAHAPEVVVSATCPAHVQAAVQHAAAQGLSLAVQATGHGCNAPITGGMLVSTRRLDTVQIDPTARTARVGAGVKFRAVIDAAAPYGLAPLNGSTSDVGVVGYTLGGGLPVLGRTFGYSADHVRSLEVVTADGLLREVDADDEPDLFWGLRGGKGNLAVVTAVTIDLVPVTTVFGGGIFYAAEHIPTVLEGYRQWSPSLPEDCCTSVAVLRLPPFPDIPEPLRGKTLAHLRMCHLGGTDEGERLVGPMRALAPAVIDTLAEMPYTAVDSIHQDPDHPVPFYERSALLPELAPETVARMLEHVGPEVEAPILLCELRHLGGALSRPPNVPNAVGGRSAAYSLAVVGVLAPPVADRVPVAVDALVQAMEPWSGGRTLLNMHGVPGDAVDRARAWEPEAFQRLRDLRRRYDPAGLFRSGHVIEAEDR